MRLILFVFNISLLLSIFGQSNNDLDYYFNDSGLSNPNTIIKTTALTTLVGHLEFSIEQKIAQRFTIEPSLGYQTKFFLPPYMVIIPIEYPIEIGTTNENLTGYGISLALKYYHTINCPEGWYSGLVVRHRTYNLSPASNNITIFRNTEYLYQAGGQILAKGRLVIEGYTGFGIGRYLEKIDATTGSSSQTYYIQTVNFKFGIQL